MHGLSTGSYLECVHRASWNAFWVIVYWDLCLVNAHTHPMGTISCRNTCCPARSMSQSYLNQSYRCLPDPIHSASPMNLKAYVAKKEHTLTAVFADMCSRA
mmetsp:Transcript_134173/g.232948  ORF Transcript_134173/g.232948 Transcript_134173/m.232948 type:complete len:101 (-) Transcript_134173:291-593(-)